MIPAGDPTGCDPLLLLPGACRRAAVLGRLGRVPEPLQLEISRFARLASLEAAQVASRPLDALVALDPPADLARLARAGGRCLPAGGTLVAHVANGPLGRPLRAAWIRRRLAEAGFGDIRIFAWLSTPIYRQVLFPLADDRMPALVASLSLPGERRRVRLLRRLGAFFPPAWLAPRLLVVARKGA